jgi:ATP-binding cassette subfamily D (ALD) long-chain fatty acid import protein
MAPNQSKPVGLGTSAAVRARTIRAIISQLTAMYLRNRAGITRAITITMVVGLANQIRRFIARQRAASARADAARAKRPGTTSAARGGESDGIKEERIGLNREFIRSLMKLLRIIMPGWRTKEVWLLICHTFFLIARTMISLQVAALDGAIVKAMVKGNGREFLMRLVHWMLLSIPATYTNSRLVWHQSALAMRYRTRLTEHIHDRYLSNLTFYTISALDDRIRNPEQLIATDVAKFSDNLADLYSNLAKPIFDLVSPS